MRVAYLSAAGLIAAFAVAAWGSSQQHAGARTAVPRPVAQAAAASHTATFAETPGEEPQYIFPLNPSEFYTFANDQRFDYLIYPPLYSLDNNGEPALNASRSLAQPARFTVNKAGQSVATIVLNHYLWSDGKPVTSRDVKFWMNLLIANKAQWGDYVPKQFPDNVTKITYPSASKIVVTFNAQYNPTWLQYNELSQINPIPQHVWDRTSLSGRVGNYDMTPKGAVAVRNFLNAQSRQGSTYASSPLWRVVDGAWKISAFVPSTGYLALVRNTRYSGSVTGNVTKLAELPFTSTIAELNALRSGSVDYGYVPTEDATPGQEAGLKAQGYNIVPWYVWGWNYWPVDFAQPTTGPLFKQLYVRQALQELIAQAEWIKQFLHGVGTVESGAVPTNFKTPFAGPAQRHLVYHYSPSAARKLLTSHGWKISSGAADVCVKPGTGANECGAGIKGGATLSFNLLYSSGIPALAQESVAFQTSASSVGIHVSLTSRPYDTVFADYFSCLGKPASSCNWDMINSQVSDFYGWYPDYYPVGAANWVTGALFNGQQYSNPTMNRLLEAAHRGTGLASLYRAEAYVSKELPELWVPNSAYQISAISKKLHVPMPQGSMTNIYPESWTMK